MKPPISLSQCFFSLLLALSIDAHAQPQPTLTKPPQLLEFVEAPYPEAELEQARDAAVVLSIVVGVDGSVAKVDVLESAGVHFDAAALAAAQNFHFSPAEIDGQPASVRLTYRYTFSKPEPSITTGSFRGVVRDKRRKTPVEGANVEVIGVGNVVTGSDGAFEFKELTIGPIDVRITVHDGPSFFLTEEITKGQITEASYDIEEEEPEPEVEPEDDFEVVVRAPPQLDRQVTSIQVQAEEARKVPGTQGDVLKVVESLPGVARSSAGSGNVIVWGSSPNDTRTYVGAVRIPALYHFSGLRSVIHGDSISGVELIPGGYGAPFGRGLGGLLLIERRSDAPERLQGSLAVDLLDTSLAIRAPVSDKVQVELTGRKSYVAELGSLLSDQSFQQFFTLPNYYDGQARVGIQLSENESIQFGGLVSSDERIRTRPSTNPAFRSTEAQSLSFERIDASYRRETADGTVVTVSPWWGHDKSSSTLTFGDTRQSLTNDTNLVGLRIDYQGYLVKHIAARTGLDFEFTHSELNRVGALTIPPREGDGYVFGRAPSSGVSADTWSAFALSAAPYLEFDVSFLEDKLHVIPGIRLEPYILSTNRNRPLQETIPDRATLVEDIGIEPRLMLRYAPLTDLSFQAGGGLYRQPPQAEDLSAVFGNPLLDVGRGAHALVGAKYSLLDWLSAEVTLFHTRTWDIVSRNPSANPQVAQTLVQEGDGRTFGGQLLLRKDKTSTSKLFGWVTYTLLRSERRNAGSEDYRLFDYDQTHVLTAVGSYDLGAGFEAGLRVRIASGYPRTPVIGSYFDARRGVYEPILGPRNSIRIPEFFQIDARFSKSFRFDSSKLELYLDVQNVTNQGNAEELAYSPDYSEQRYILGLPILPVIGARWEF